VDLLRPGAIPALILAASFAPAAASGADFKALEARYKVVPVGPGADTSAALNQIAEGPERSKLYRLEGGSKPSSLTQGGVMTRPKYILLAATGVLKHTPGKTRIEFFDAEGKSLATVGIEKSAQWRCRNGRLERTYTVSAGLGDAVRTERVEETLERNAAGELVFRKLVTTMDLKGKEPARSEWRYASAP
jgi:hypothetical protein